MHCEDSKKWLIGFIISTLLVWQVAPLFLDGMVQWGWSEELGCYVQPEGFVRQQRSEGWASTEFGKFGISGIADVTQASVPRVAIWGDSVVEGCQVADDKKLAQQLTQIWNAKYAENPILGVGLGMSGRAISDYCLLMKNYEAVVDPCIHFIIVATLDDISPDGIVFKSTPEFHFIKREARSKKEVQIRKWLEPFRLEFAYVPSMKFVKSWSNGQQLRFRLGEVSASSQNAKAKMLNQYSPSVDAWRYAIKTLKASADRPVVIVCAPTHPVLKHGEILYDADNPEEQAVLASLCEEQGVGFINLRDRFENEFIITKKFSFGFHNGVIGEGHPNVLGHRLIAEEIAQYLEVHSDAFHSD